MKLHARTLWPAFAFGVCAGVLLAAIIFTGVKHDCESRPTLKACQR